jgi:hypothetical protein
MGGNPYQILVLVYLQIASNPNKHLSWLKTTDFKKGDMDLKVLCLIFLLLVLAQKNYWPFMTNLCQNI